MPHNCELALCSYILTTTELALYSTFAATAEQAL